MRHKVSGKHLGRTSAHRRALRRNLAASLFEHGTISTTIEKAKFVRPFAEKLITLARDGSLHARRRAISLLQDRDICKEQDGDSVKETTVIKKLFEEIGPRFTDRNGGYTRIVRLPLRRIGDNGRLAILQLVGDLTATESAPAAKTREKAPVREKVTPKEKIPVEEIPEEAPAEAEVAEAEPETPAEETIAEETTEEKTAAEKPAAEEPVAEEEETKEKKGKKD